MPFPSTMWNGKARFNKDFGSARIAELLIKVLAFANDFVLIARTVSKMQRMKSLGTIRRKQGNGGESHEIESDGL